MFSYTTDIISISDATQDQYSSSSFPNTVESLGTLATQLGCSNRVFGEDQKMNHGAIDSEMYHIDNAHLSEMDDDAAYVASYPPTRKDWDHFRPIIKRLYIDQSHSLSEVRSIMEQKYHFKATLKMFSGRRSQWGLFKNLKKDDLVAMKNIQHIRGRQGKQSIFLRHGTKIDPELMARSAKRKNLLQLKLRNVGSDVDGGQMLNSKIVCMSPPPRLRQLEAPQCLKQPEDLLRVFGSWLARSYEGGLCWRVHNTLKWASKNDAGYLASTAFLNLMRGGLNACVANNHRMAGIQWRRAFLCLEDMITEIDLLAWMYFLSICLDLVTGGNANLAEMTIRHGRALYNRAALSNVSYSAIGLQACTIQITELSQVWPALSSLVWQTYDDLFDFGNGFDLELLAGLLLCIQAAQTTIPRPVLAKANTALEMAALKLLTVDLDHCDKEAENHLELLYHYIISSMRLEVFEPARTVLMELTCRWRTETESPAYLVAKYGLAEIQYNLDEDGEGSRDYIGVLQGLKDCWLSCGVLKVVMLSCLERLTWIHQHSDDVQTWNTEYVMLLEEYHQYPGSTWESVE